MVWPWGDGRVWSGGQRAGLLMCWRVGERPLEMRDMSDMPHSMPGPQPAVGMRAPQA